MEHVESRKSERDSSRFDIFFVLNIKSQNFLNLLKTIRQKNLGQIRVLRERLISVKGKNFNVQTQYDNVRC